MRQEVMEAIARLGGTRTAKLSNGVLRPARNGGAIPDVRGAV
jgi:hypothetical protein